MVDSLGCEDAIASDTDEMKGGKSGAAWRHPIAPCEALHVAINCGQNRFVGQSGRANHLVCRALRKNLAMKYDSVPAGREYVPDGIWNASV